MAVAIADPLERATLAKVTHRLIPFLFLLYIVCFLDRVNIGFAALQIGFNDAAEDLARPPVEILQCRAR